MLRMRFAVCLATVQINLLDSEVNNQATTLFYIFFLYFFTSSFLFNYDRKSNRKI
jgi:hypothetical protein